MCTASWKWDNVVNLLDRCCSALFKALLTQRVCLHIAVTNFFPRSAVLLVDINRSCESVVLLCIKPLMLLTIPPVCKFWTVWICTTLLWFMWHKLLLSGIRKALQISLQGFQSLFHCLYYSRCAHCNSMEFTVNFRGLQHFLMRSFLSWTHCQYCNSSVPLFLPRF